MKRQYLVIVAVAAVLLLLVGAGILVYALAQGGTLPFLRPTPTASTSAGAFPPAPTLKVTPPASLDDIAAGLQADYPELAELLKDPKLGSVYKDFYLAYQKGGQEAAIALAKQRGILNNKNEIEMTLVLDTSEAAPLIKELEAEKVIIKGSYGNKINIAIPVALIEEQIKAKNPDLIVKRISNLNHVIRLEVTPKAKTNQGLIQGQGVNKTFAANWQQQGITGKGVKVGILDLGFAGYEQLLGNELPAKVTLKAFGDETMLTQEVHGAACAEIIHEMAPDAELYLAYYDGSDVTMGQAVDWLLEQGVNIISNSTGSNGLTPMDGTGFAEDLVNRAYQQDVLWVNAAGNEADTHWRGSFNDPDNDTIHEFKGDTEVLPFIPFAPDEQTEIILSWNDWQKVDQDYNLLLLDKEGNLLAKSEELQTGLPGQLPVEGFLYQFDNEEIRLLAIENPDGKAKGDALFNLFIHGAAMHPDFQEPAYSLSNPADARGALAVGAVNWANDVLEPYSSRGPTTDGRIKPDLAAPSVVDSRSYSPDAFNGTSAAAPHVSGAAALVWQAFPKFKPNDITKFLQERSLDLGDTGPDNSFGAGRLNLGAAPNKAEKPAATPAPPPNVEIQPSSTPRPPDVVNQPGQPVGIGGQTGGEPGAPGQSQSTPNDLVGMLVLLGLCMTCLAGLLFVLIIGFVVIKRRK
jgi:subtilisin family serine protease